MFSKKSSAQEEKREIPQKSSTEDVSSKSLSKLAKKYSTTEKELQRTKRILDEEKSTKRKLYSSMVKLANELKDLKSESAILREMVGKSPQNWYDGGMWRSPNVLPQISSGDSNSTTTTRDPVSLTDLFLDLVIVTAFSRVGDAIISHGKLSWSITAYFAIFWFIWLKEASYSTRFDTSDLSSQIETLITCFAVLFGTFSSTQDFGTSNATRIMVCAFAVAALHFLLHARVAFWYREAPSGSEGALAKTYAHFIMAMTFLEGVTWLVGIFFVPIGSPNRWIVFLLAILFSLRIPKAFLPNDFHAASSKRGVLFILLLGFLLQSIVTIAAPWFEYDSPSTDQYLFLGTSCFLLYCIKLLYVDDTYSINPSDHALLVNRYAGFCFQIGQFGLLLSTVVLGSGLQLLTRSYMSSTEALANNSKTLVTGGFSAVLASIFLIKSMHVRRVPVNTFQSALFYVAYGLQALVYVAVIAFSGYLAMSSESSIFTSSEMSLMFSLAGASVFVVLMSWIDEMIEVTLYGNSGDAQNYRINAFGIFSCCLEDEDDENLRSSSGFIMDVESSPLSARASSNISERTPLVENTSKAEF